MIYIVKMTYVICEHCLTSYTIHQLMLQSKVIFFLIDCLSCINVDATHFDSFGKLVNDSPDRFTNAVMKKFFVDGWAYLVLFLIRPIQKGEELKYNYGESNLTWRKNVNILCLLYFMIYFGHHKDHLKICNIF